MAKANIPTRDELNIPDYPGNSNKEKEEAKKQKVECLVKGKTIRKKKGVVDKILDTFVGEDTDGVFDYIVKDILIPAGKNALYDAVTGGLGMRLFGDPQAISIKRGNGYRPQRDYSKCSRQPGRSTTIVHEDRRGRPGRTRVYVDDIYYESRPEADEVLEGMRSMIDDYGEVTVANYYEFSQVPSSPSDNHIGWDDLRYASVKLRPRDGTYFIDLPRAVVLDD